MLMLPAAAAQAELDLELSDIAPCFRRARMAAMRSHCSVVRAGDIEGITTMDRGVWRPP